MLSEANPSVAADKLESILATTLDATCPYTPVKPKKKKTTSQPWFFQGLKVSAIHKQRLYKKSLRNPNRLPFYRKYRNLYNKLVKLAKINHYKKLLKDAAHNKRKTWSILNKIISKQSSNNSSPDVIYATQPDNFIIQIEEPLAIAEYFYNFFSSTGERFSTTNSSKDLPSPLNFMSQINTSNSIFLGPTDKNEIIKTCLSVKSKTSTGHDGVNNKLLKLIIPHIAEPLCHIFNQSFQLGIFPDTYKISKVIPVFKCGDKSDPNNYRPISLLPAISKILEKIVYKRVINFIFANNLIYPEQYGFLQGRSTEHAILDIVQRITENIENKQFTLGIFWTCLKRLIHFPTIYFSTNSNCTAFEVFPTHGLKVIYLADLNMFPPKQVFLPTNPLHMAFHKAQFSDPFYFFYI